MNAAEIVRAAKAAGMIVPVREPFYYCPYCYVQESYWHVPLRIRGDKTINANCRGCKEFVSLGLAMVDHWPDLITGQYQTGTEFPLVA